MTFVQESLELPEDDPIVFESGGYIQIDVPKYKDLNYLPDGKKTSFL